VDKSGAFSGGVSRNVGFDAFNDLFRASSRRVIWRRMGSCNTFYVRRAGRAIDTWNAAANMYHCWVSADRTTGATNTLGVDFDMYYTTDTSLSLGSYADFDSYLASLSTATYCNYDDCNWYPNGNSFHPIPSGGWPNNVGLASGYGPGVAGFRDCNTCYSWISIEVNVDWAFLIAA